jgi:uncharacterized protein (TIGR02147 family)
MNVYDYLDYRQVIADWHRRRHTREKPMDWDDIARAAGYRSRAPLTRVLNGATRLSEGAAKSLARLFGFSKAQADYFLKLVQYSHAGTSDVKQQTFESLIAMRSKRVRTLSPAYHSLFDRWYFVAIREMLDFFHLDDNYEELAKRLRPRITVAQARRAVSTLESLGLVRRGPDGFYRRSDAVVSTGDQWSGAAIRDFQITMASMAREALFDTAPAIREIATLTLSISADSFAAIRRRLRSVRTELLNIARTDSHADRVYQVNIQFFPLTGSESGDCSI